MMKPIRVGFIGLSSNKNALFAGAWGKNAHLPYLTKNEDYTITALCNSSVRSAKKAIEVHGLDATKVRAYGDPTSLANDPDIDLVVCSVNVKEHYNLVKPAVSAGKMVFCEWPLASNLAQMKELADLAAKNGAKTFVGLQGRNGAYNDVIRSFIGNGEGRLGKVLSTSMTGYGRIHGMGNPKDVAYLMDMKTGGNVFTISAIHHLVRKVLDTLTATLGEIKSSSTILKNQRPTMALLDESFSVIEPAHPNDTPEHILIQGELQGNVLLDFQIRGGPAFQGTPSFDWRIYCQRGEIRLFGDGMLWLAGGIKVQVSDFVSQKVTDVELQTFLEENKKDDVAVKEGLEAPADNVARLYDAFRKGETEKYLDFGQCLKWAEFIQKAYTANGF